MTKEVAHHWERVEWDRQRIAVVLEQICANLLRGDRVFPSSEDFDQLTLVVKGDSPDPIVIEGSDFDIVYGNSANRLYPVMKHQKVGRDNSFIIWKPRIPRLSFSRRGQIADVSLPAEIHKFVVNRVKPLSSKYGLEDDPSIPVFEFPYRHFSTSYRLENGKPPEDYIGEYK